MDQAPGNTGHNRKSEQGLTKKEKIKDTNVQSVEKKTIKTKKSNVLEKDSNVKSKSPSKQKMSSPVGKVSLTPMELSKLKKDGSIKMVKAGTYLVPGKGIVKTPEKKHKTILNSMRKSPVKKANEDKQEKGELENRDEKCNTADKLSQKKGVKKMKRSDISKDLNSSNVPEIQVKLADSKDDAAKVKKQRSPKKKEDGSLERVCKQTVKDSPKSRKTVQLSDSSSLKVKSRPPSKSPSPIRKKQSSSQDKNLSLLKTPNIGTETSRKRSRSPNVKTHDPEKSSPKRRSSPRSGSSSKSSSPSKRSTPSDNSSASTSSTTTSSSDTTPEKDSSPLNKSSAMKKLFPEDEDNDQISSSDSSDESSGEESEEEVTESPVFEGLENCSIRIDKKSLGMWKSLKYKYEAKPSNSLSDLIAKVNSNIETPDEERNKIFGTAESVDCVEEMCSPGREGEANEINDSMDSDKTVTEFGAANSSAIISQNISVSDECTEKDDKTEDNDETKMESSSTVECVPDDLDKETNAQENEETKVSDPNTNESSDDKTVKSENQENEKNIEKEDLEEKQEEPEPTEEINIFEHFGLKLKKKTDTKDEVKVPDVPETRNTDDKANTGGQDDTDDVVCISDSNVDDVVVISDEDSVANSPVKKKKFMCVNHIVEPKPIEILTNLERQVRDKRVAFLSEELEEYIDVNKENMGPLYRTLEEEKSETSSSTKTSPSSKESTYNPDMDEVDGFMFVSFSSEEALKAHTEIEQKVEWLNEGFLKRLAQLRVMKERQMDEGKRRVTDVKSVDEQKQNFRGLHMKYTKYQKLLRDKIEGLTNPQYTPEKSMRSPEKTSDITKIKGWKNKFKSTDDMQEAARVNLSESGKLHWKTEDMLLRNLNPDDMKDIGLDLKKKRRKLVNYSNKKKYGSSKSHKTLVDDDFDYLLDDDAITEKDVFNEDDEKPIPDKIPYSEKYLSQFKYGARKMFVKKMKLDAEDEKILKKLGTNKLYEKEKDKPVAQSNVRTTRGRQLVFGKITQQIATAAVSAFDVKLFNKAKKLVQSPQASKKVSNKRVVKDEHDGVEPSQYDYESSNYTDGNSVKQEPLDESDYSIPTQNRAWKDKERKKSFDKCNQPGCRYGCICHLCKLSDSSEEKESDKKPPCDKEYCKLGCICESIDTKQIKEPIDHCRKPACMFDCRCPPKQPKPDIPKVGGRKKKKSRGAKKRIETDKLEDEFDIKDEPLEDEVPEETDWEPPSKKKRRGVSGNRFANLPKRESTYRLAKNLDAVSRKAMILYESSEMYAEQRIRRRRSDPMGDFMYDDPYGELDEFPPDFVTSQERFQPKKALTPPIPSHKLDPETGVLEISDDDVEIEGYLGTCARSVMFNWDKNREKNHRPLPPQFMPSTSKLSFSTSSSTVRPPRDDVIELPDTDDEEKEVNQRSSNKAVSQLTVSQRLGLSKKKEEHGESAKWKTQMVCLKAKKKSEDNSSNPQSEIKLLEIISNCSWENDRTNMLSKISHIISKDYPANFLTLWQSYVLQFLPKADKPAVIPPELQSKLPNSMYSIRVRVTQNITDIEQAENDAKEDDAEKEDDYEGMKNMSDEDRKKFFIKQQSKLIEKIKFAEKLRDLIRNEELNGIAPSKFSVSLEGIEKALKRYKTQLWKAYTGSSNKSLMQIKQAVQALKGSGGTATRTDTNDAQAVECTGVSNAHDGLTTSKEYIKMPSGCGMSSGTLSRLQANQGFKLHNSVSLANNGKSFISLGSIKSNSNVTHLTGSNITIMDQTLSTRPGQDQSLISTKVRPVTASHVNSEGKEVLLIPIQDSGRGKWDPSTSPVFTAKVSMIPTDAGKTSINNSLVNLTPVSSTGAIPPNVPVRMVMGPRSATPKLTKPILNPALSAYAHAPFLPGHGYNRSASPGNSQILFSSIQPISSGSPVFSQVQSMMTTRMPTNRTPLNPAQVRPLKTTMTPIGICRPQVPNVVSSGKNTITGVQIQGDISQIGRPGNITAFSPHRYTVPSANSTSGSRSLINNTSTRSQPQPMILVPVSSSGGSMPALPKPGQNMIAYPISNITAGEFPRIPPTTKLVRKVSPQTVPKPSVPDDGRSLTTDNRLHKQDNLASAKSDLIVVKDETCDSKSSDVESSIESVHNKLNPSGKPREVNDLDNCDGNRKPDSRPNSACSESSLRDNAIDKTSGEISKVQVKTNDIVTVEDESPSFKMRSIFDEAKLAMSGEVDKVLSDITTQGKIVYDVEGTVDDNEGISRKRKMEMACDDGNVSKASKMQGALNIADLKTAANLESEDSDVDIVSFDHESLESTKLQQTSRRKTQQVSMSLDDFEIKSVKVKSYQPKIPVRPPGPPDLNLGQSKNVMERSRRHFDRYYRDILAKTTFKYNPDISVKLVSTCIPQHLVLSEARKLIRALKHKAARLQESVADGKQYQQSLKDTLRSKIDEFVRSGVPEPILKNFLKSVSKANSSAPKKKPTSETPILEESDTDLDYDRLCASDIMRNTKYGSLERVLEAIGGDIDDIDLPHVTDVDQPIENQGQHMELENHEQHMVLDNHEQHMVPENHEHQLVLENQEQHTAFENQEQYMTLENHEQQMILENHEQHMVLENQGQHMVLENQEQHMVLHNKELVPVKSTLESLDSGIYIDHAERDIVDISSDDAVNADNANADDTANRSLDADAMSDVEIRSSTGDVLLESDLLDLDVEESASVVNMNDPVIDSVSGVVGTELVT